MSVKLIHCITHHYEASNYEDLRYMQHNKSDCKWTDQYDPLIHCDEPPKPLKKLDRKIKVKGRVGNTFVESIMLNGKPAFLCSKKGSEDTFTQESIEYDGILYNPVQELQPYDDYSFTSTEIENLNAEKPTRENLLESIRKQVQHFIVASEESKDLTTIDVFLSYCMEHVSTIHFPFYVGETESGKSSCAHLFKNLGYRCLYSLDMTTPNVYQFLGQDEEGQGIIVEDEAQGIYDNPEKIRLYKGSYSRGSKIVRIIGVDTKDRKQVTYFSFGLKVFAGEKLPQDKGFLERLAVVKMIEGIPAGNIKRLMENEKQTLEQLRKECLVWKVQNYWKGLPNIETDLKNRDQELWEDFLRVASGTRLFENAKLVVRHYTDQRHESIRNSLEAKLLRIIINNLNDDCEVVIQDLWNFILSSENHILTGKQDGHLSFKLDEFAEKLSMHKVVALIKNKFSGTSIERNIKVDGKYRLKTSYAFNSDIILKLVEKYRIEIPNFDHPLYKHQKGQNGTKSDQSDSLDPLTAPQNNKIIP